MKSHKSHTLNLSDSQAGFTIVELMIATLVFSVILLVITVGVMAFTNSYYKGVNSSATQNAAQSAVDDISQAIQFGGSGTVGVSAPAAGSDGVFCAGTRLFLFSSGVQYMGATPTDGNWGLYMINNPNTASCTRTGLTAAQLAGGSELLSPRMRVADFSLGQLGASPTTWQVTLRVAYGDADLLCSVARNGNAGGCSGSGSTNLAASANFADNQMQCRSQIGSQFCSVAVLTAVAQQRLMH